MSGNLIKDVRSLNPANKNDLCYLASAGTAIDNISILNIKTPFAAGLYPIRILANMDIGTITASSTGLTANNATLIYQAVNANIKQLYTFNHAGIGINFESAVTTLPDSTVVKQVNSTDYAIRFQGSAARVGASMYVVGAQPFMSGGSVTLGSYRGSAFGGAAGSHAFYPNADDHAF